MADTYRVLSGDFAELLRIAQNLMTMLEAIQADNEEDEKTQPENAGGKRYKTIREAAADSSLPNEAILRAMVKSGICPGFYAGTRFYVDTILLRANLQEEYQLKNMKGRNR